MSWLPAGSPSSASAAAAGAACGAVVRLRDHMDGILEPRGYFRKHMAPDGDALFRAVADVLFGTQQRLHQVLAKVFESRLATSNVMEEIIDNELNHPKVRAMAKLFNIHFNVIEMSDPSINLLIIKPDDYLSMNKEELEASAHCKKGGRSEKKQGSCRKSRRILLCTSSSEQYDPVYPRDTIDVSAMVQSIVYEHLYTEVFHVPDALKAAEKMLDGMFADWSHKPDLYHKDFEGTALEALEQFCIPFPFKVAKALDPKSYRNLEYDVWTNEQRIKSGSNSNSSSPSSKPRSPSLFLSQKKHNSRDVTIGTLAPGTPCIVRLTELGDAYGMIVKPSRDRKNMEVFLPEWNQSVFVPRKDVLPVKETPFVYDYMGPTINPTNTQVYYGVPANTYFVNEPVQYTYSPFTTDSTSNVVQSRNLGLLQGNDPNWLYKSDFSVPPPASPVVQVTSQASGADQTTAVVSQSPVHPPVVFPTSLEPMTPVSGYMSVVSPSAVPQTPQTPMFGLPEMAVPASPHIYNVDSNGNILHPPSPFLVYNYPVSYTPQPFGAEASPVIPMGTPYPFHDGQVFQFPQEQ